MMLRSGSGSSLQHLRKNPGQTDDRGDFHLEMTTRWERSGFRVKVLGGVWMHLRTRPSYTIMSGGQRGQSFSILVSQSIIL